MLPFLTTMTTSPDDTAALGQKLGAILKKGDLVLLSAPLGMGKTVLARGIVQAVMGDGVDVPSPTFTIVQTYEGHVPLWHADLFRLEQPEEVNELGLDEALDGGAVLVEWPEQGEGFLPKGGLHITGTEGPEGARLWQLAGDLEWAQRMAQG